MKSKSSPDIAEARSFVGSTAHVCPFGTRAEREGNVLYARAQAPNFTLSASVLDFVKNPDKEALIIVLPRENNGLERARVRTNDYYLAIARVLIKDQDRKLTFPEIEAIIREQFVPHMGRDAEQHLFLSFRNRALYLIYMGPEYQPNAEGVPHARYSPVPMLVMTRHEDVFNAKRDHPRVFDEVRERMRAAMGGIYDASERFLEQDPEIIEP